MISIKGKSGNSYSFDGPYSSVYFVDDRSGVYAIIDSTNTLLDVGESSEPRTRLINHDRKDCWERKKRGNIQYCIYYTPNLQQSGRKEVEQDIRDNYSNLCGDR